MAGCAHLIKTIPTLFIKLQYSIVQRGVCCALCTQMATELMSGYSSIHSYNHYITTACYHWAGVWLRCVLMNLPTESAVEGVGLTSLWLGSIFGPVCKQSAVCVGAVIVERRGTRGK